MSYTSGFFDAVDLGGGDYDREYSAAVFAHYFSLLVKNGVFPDPSTGMQVKASASPDMHVSVQPGSGWVNGYYITVPENSPEVLTVPTANPSLSRIDSVIMGLNYVEREVQLYIKSGAVSASPSAVSLQRDNDLYEMELAQITVAAGVASISQANITDMRANTSRCGIVKGTIDQIDTTDLFAQYDDAFQTWFADIQYQLSGDIATNLQNQINSLKSDKVNVSDKASMAQAQAGTDNTKWMTPALSLALLDYRLATTSEAQAGSVDNKLMTPAKVRAWWDSLYSSLLLPISKGGTGKSSWATNRLVYPSGPTTLDQLAPPSVVNSVLAQSNGAPFWRSDIATQKDLAAALSDATGNQYSLPLKLNTKVVNGVVGSSGAPVHVGDYLLYDIDFSSLPSGFFGAYFDKLSSSGGSSDSSAFRTYLIINGVSYDLGVNQGKGSYQNVAAFNSVTKLNKIIKRSELSTMQIKWVVVTEPGGVSGIQNTWTINGFIKEGMS